MNELELDAAKLPLRIEPIPELTNLWTYASSTTSIGTEPPLYPEPNVRSSKNSYASPPPT